MRHYREMTKISISYIWFQIIITLMVALVFLAEVLKPYIMYDIYLFLKKNRDIFLGIYYLYITYEVYRRYIVEEKMIVFEDTTK